jgi:hypothetical protein
MRLVPAPATRLRLCSASGAQQAVKIAEHFSSKADQPISLDRFEPVWKFKGAELRQSFVFSLAHLGLV